MHLLSGALLALPLFAAEVPKGCEFAVSEGQDATLACFQDLDRDGDGALSRAEAEVLPRIKGHFDALDADGNLMLSPAEFQGAQTTPPQRAGAKGV
jgi:hypothetical protein